MGVIIARIHLIAEKYVYSHVSHKPIMSNLRSIIKSLISKAFVDRDLILMKPNLRI